MKFWHCLLLGCASFLAAAWGGPSKSYAEAANGTESNRSACGTCRGADRADDMWIVSTRHLGCPAPDKMNEAELYVEHYGGKDLGWVEASVDELLAGNNPAQRTMIYVPGNRVEWNDAIAQGWNVRNSILGRSSMEPIRFVIWSWPSDKIHGQIRDIRVKAARTNGEAHYLARLLSQLEPAAPLSILSYSYGARVTTGALHLLGGGKLVGQTLPAAHSSSAHSVRVVLLAPAIHNYWLQPGAYHEHALSQMDRLLIHYNSCDPVLRHYKLVEKHACPAALGYTGMRVDESAGVVIDQRNVCCIVGKSHSEPRYLASATLAAEMLAALFGE